MSGHLWVQDVISDREGATHFSLVGQVLLVGLLCGICLCDWWNAIVLSKMEHSRS